LRVKGRKEKKEPYLVGIAAGAVAAAGADELDGLDGATGVFATAGAEFVDRLGVGMADFVDAVAASFV